MITVCYKPESGSQDGLVNFPLKGLGHACGAGRLYVWGSEADCQGKVGPLSLRWYLGFMYLVFWFVYLR